MNRTTALIAAATVMIFSALAQPQKAAAIPPSGDAQSGRRIYVAVGCYQCHGREGQGSAATGPRLGPKPIPFSVFSQYVRQPTGQMPPYTSKVLSDGELGDIYAFLRALPAARAVKDIPLLQK